MGSQESGYSKDEERHGSRGRSPHRKVFTAETQKRSGRPAVRPYHFGSRGRSPHRGLENEKEKPSVGWLNNSTPHL